MIQWDADIYLCEGIIDSLCYDNAVPLMGKKLSKESYLYKRLNEKANGHIIICLEASHNQRLLAILKLLRSAIGNVCSQEW